MAGKYIALPKGVSEQTFDFTWGERLGADEVSLHLETSTDLADWIPAPGDGSEIQVLYANTSDGTRTVLARLVDLSAVRKYVRIGAGAIPGERHFMLQKVAPRFYG